MRATTGGIDRHHDDESVVLNWHAGTLQPYSSLWLIMHRIALINQMSIVEVRAISKNGSFSSGMHSLIKNKNTLDIRALATAIGERPQSLAYSTLQPFATWTHRYFLTTSIQYCPTCLSLGFHSVFLCLTLMKRCPIHGEVLRQHCSCGAPISACVTPFTYHDAGICQKCQHRFLDIHQARRPSLHTESLSVFDEVRDWLLGIGSRVSTMLPQELSHQSSIVRTDATAELATRALSLSYPICLEPQQAPPHVETVRSCQAPWATYGSQSTDPCPSPRTVVFRAIDRYLRRHVLRGQKWITRLVMHADAQYIAYQIASKPDAFLAWTYLLWLMAIFQSSSLRALRERDAYQAYQRGIRVVGCNMYKGPFVDVRTVEWLEYHAAETSLLAIWRSLHQAVISMSLNEDPRWGPDIACGSGRFQWIGLQQTNGTKEFAAIQCMGARFSYAVRPPKPHQHLHQTGNSRKQGVELQSLTPRGLVKLPGGDWEAGSLTPATQEDLPYLKAHRLLHVDDPLHFIVVHSTGVDGFFAARLVEFGLEGRGADTRSAIQCLRIAVRQYTKQNGASRTWTLPRAVPK